MYSFILDGMTWSYSRIKTYEECPYRFFLKYIYGCEDKPLFFAEYGSFVHDVLEQFYLKKLTRDGAVTLYLSKFASKVTSQAPSPSVYLSFFKSGLSYLEIIEHPSGEVLAAEKYVRFKLDQYPFIGFVDLVIKAEDQSIEIWDHKSHPLKERSGRKTPTKTDQELDEYLRQLYLYAIPIAKCYGVHPSRLVFNCYRKGIVIKEPFRPDRLEEARNWALSKIAEIRRAKAFPPVIEFFKCKYLCSVHDHCEYFGASS